MPAFIRISRVSRARAAILRNSNTPIVSAASVIATSLASISVLRVSAAELIVSMSSVVEPGQSVSSFPHYIIPQRDGEYLQQFFAIPSPNTMYLIANLLN